MPTLTQSEFFRKSPKVWDRVLAHLPVLDTMDPHVWVGGLERAIMDKTTPRHEPRRASVPLLRGDAVGVLGRLDLLAQRGVSAFLCPRGYRDPHQRSGSRCGGMRTETVCGDDARERGMILAQLGPKPFGSLAFTSIVGRPIVPPQRFWHQGHHCPAVRRNNGGAQHVMTIGDRPMAVDCLRTRGAGHGWEGKILGAIERQSLGPLQKHPRCQRLATLELSQDALAHGTQDLGGNRVKDGAQMRVARDALQTVDGAHIALGALLVKGQERGRFEGNHGKGRHQRSG